MPNQEFTAIVGVYSGTRNVLAILQALDRMTVPPTHTFLWINAHPGGTRALQGSAQNVTVIRADRNLGCFARFSAAALCDTEFVMVLDDDTVPGAQWAENCLATMDAVGDAVLGTRGIILEREAYWPHRAIGSPEGRDETTECDLVGHNWFFRRRTAMYLLAELPLRRDTGEDIQLSACAKMAGIRTYCPPHPVPNPRVWGSTVPSLGTASDRISTRQSTEEHFASRAQVVRHWIGRGWRPLFMERAAT